MPQTQVSTTPLFQTSLRMWQANWKASHGGAGGAEPADVRRSQRVVRLSRRSRRDRKA